LVDKLSGERNKYMFEENQAGKPQLHSIPFLATTTQGNHPQILHIPKSLTCLNLSPSNSLLLPRPVKV